MIIALNEEEPIRQCLESVSWADEIIVVDAGSRDKTVTVAKQYTDKVFTEENWQGFGIQRQRAQQYASTDWILMIDADEQVTPELKQEIEVAVSNNDQTRIYALPRLPYCFGRFISHIGWYPDYVIRLYPREKAGYGTEIVHEKLHYPGSMQLVKLKGDLLHYTYRDLEHYLVKSANYAAA